MIASNELCLAQKFVNDYTVDPILPDHFETEACERFLTAGITAHKWLCRAEESLHAAVEHGITPHDPTLDEAVDGLYRRWLAACERAEHLRSFSYRTVNNILTSSQDRLPLEVEVAAKEATRTHDNIRGGLYYAATKEHEC